MVVSSSKHLLVRFLVALLGGGTAWRWWLALNAAGFALGVSAFLYGHHHGLQATSMTDQVPWGAYIANFGFFVGMGTAPVMVALPALIYRRAPLRPVIFTSQALGLTATLVALLFVVVDVERLDRMWHMMPGVGYFNFPQSMLAWDVVVLNGYFFLVAGTLAYSVIARLRGREPRARVVTTMGIFTALWALGMHTVTAFLYAGFAGRPFWNTAVLAPRFLVSAIATGTAALLLATRAMEEEDGADALPQEARRLIERTLSVALAADLFLIAGQAFVEFYAQGSGVTPLRYLLLGIGPHRALVPWAWLGAFLEIAACVFFALPETSLARVERWLGKVPSADVACGGALVGIWFTKGMSLVIPGFVPSQLGEIVEYVPSLVEALVSLGVWCFGLIALSVLLRLERAANSAVRAP